MARKVTGPGGK